MSILSATEIALANLVSASCEPRDAKAKQVLIGGAVAALIDELPLTEEYREAALKDFLEGVEATAACALAALDEQKYQEEHAHLEHVCRKAGGVV